MSDKREDKLSPQDDKALRTKIHKLFREFDEATKDIQLKPLRKVNENTQN
ncbi:MAG: hypothetical protein AAFQ07_00235 [Chloroflexota bacterium]